jgi:hypothetical protein
MTTLIFLLEVLMPIPRDFPASRGGLEMVITFVWLYFRRMAYTIWNEMEQIWEMLVIFIVKVISYCHQ